MKIPVTAFVARLGMVVCLFAIAVVVPLRASESGRPDLVWMRGGHSAPVRTLAYSPDGQVLVTASDDWTAKVWRVSDRKLLHTLIPGKVGCSSVAFSRDGRWLAVSTGWDGDDDTSIVKIYETERYSEVAAFTYYSSWWSFGITLAFSPDGERLAVGTEEHVEVIRSSDWTRERTLNSTMDDYGFASVQFSADGNRLLGIADADDTGRLTLWNAQDGTVSWATNIGNVLRGGSISTKRYLGGAIFSPSGDEIVCGVAGRVQVRSAVSGNLLRTLDATNAASMSFAPDSGSIALSEQLGVEPVQIFEWPSGQLLRRVQDSYGFNHVVFSPDGELLTGGGRWASPAAVAVQIWRVSDGQPEGSFDEHWSKIEQVAISPDSSLLVSGGIDNTVRLWDVATGNRTAMISRNSSISVLRFSPDSSLIAVGGRRDAFELWSTNGTLVKALNHAPVAAVDAAFSPDGRLVAALLATTVFNPYSFANPVLSVWDTVSGNVVFSTNGYGFNSPLVFSADGSELRIASGAVARWRVSDWRRLENVWNEWPRFGVVRSPDGRLEAAYVNCFPVPQSMFCGLQLNGMQLVSPGNYSIPPYTSTAMAFSPDSGTLIFAGHADNTLSLWGTTSFQSVGIYTNEIAGGAPYFIEDEDEEDILALWSGATTVAFSNDRQHFAYGRVDGTLALARNPFGSPVMITARSESTGIKLSWQGGNRYYRLQRKTEINADWQNIGLPTTATNTVVTLDSHAATFYRVLNLGN